MKNLFRSMLILLLLTAIFGCAPRRVETPRKMPVRPEVIESKKRGVVYLALIWNQSKPIFKIQDLKDASIKNFENAVTESVKDNVNLFSLGNDMRLPPITLNILPAVFKEIELLDKIRGDDLYHFAHIKAEELKEENKIFILNNFFPEEKMDFITFYDRYKELLKKRGDDVSTAIKRFKTEDYRDLQVWYYLLNQDERFLQLPFPAKLLDKERFFTEREKDTLFREMYKNIVKDLLFPYMQVSDREIMVSPYGNPLMPLLYNNRVILESNPKAALPEEVFNFPQDARELLFQGVLLYRDVFSRPLSGIWLPEGGVSQDIIGILASTGAKWFVTGADVLDVSFSKSDKENSGESVDTVKQSHYLPYRVEDKKSHREIAAIFTDQKINKEITSLLKANKGEGAAEHLLNTIGDIARGWKESQPPLVTIVLEGDIFSENWDNKGKRVIKSFINSIESNSQVKIVTPDVYLSLYPESMPIQSLGAGTFYGQGFDPWIGEEEENIGWTYLADTRKILEAYKNSGRADITKVDNAFEYMYMAENNLWFWYFGQDCDTPNDKSYERGFRALLRNVYESIGVEPPSKLYSSFISGGVEASATGMKGMISPKIDGKIGGEEWDAAGSCAALEGEGGVLERVFYGYDESNLFLRIDLKDPLAITTVEDIFLGVYFGMQGILKGNIYSRFQDRQKVEAPGFPLTYELGLEIPSINWIEPRMPKAQLSYACGENIWSPLRPLENAALSKNILEIGIPFELLRTAGNVNVGKMFVTLARNGEEIERLPKNGVVEISLPPQPFREEIIYALDPLGDDFGPGDYVYPNNSIYSKGSFDIEKFTVMNDDNGVVFKVKLEELSNPLNGRGGFSLQQIDIYMDMNNRPGAGSRYLLPGRNAYVKSSDAWEFAISVNGWDSILYNLDSLGNPQRVCEIKSEIDEKEKTIIIYLPREIIRGNPDNWGYVPILMSYNVEREGSDWDIGEVRVEPDEFHFGGGIDKYLSPNIIDVVLPYGEDQKTVLGAYKKKEAIEITALRRL